MSELQIEGTKQKQRNATFDLDLLSFLDSHRTNQRTLLLTDCSEQSFLQNTGENRYFTGVFASESFSSVFYLTHPLKDMATKVTQSNLRSITCSIALGRFSEAGHSVTRCTAHKRLKILHETEGKVILFYFSKISLLITVNLKSHQLSLTKITGYSWNIPPIYMMHKIIWFAFTQLNAAYRNQSEWKYIP